MGVDVRGRRLRAGAGRQGTALGNFQDLPYEDLRQQAGCTSIRLGTARLPGDVLGNMFDEAACELCDRMIRITR